MEEERRVQLGRQIIAYPANVPCPICGALVEDWHTEWTDPTCGPGKQYKDYFTDKDVQDADADAQADTRY
jgi:hypothetical protein